jgi:hypothetical protein
MGANKLFDRPHVLYAAVVLIVGLAFVISWSYFRNEEINMKKQEQERMTAERYAKQSEAESNASMREACLAHADMEYSEFVRLNGKKGKSDGSFTMPQHQWDYINRRTRDTKEICFKQYPPK